MPNDAIRPISALRWCALTLLVLPGLLWASGQTSTKYNVYVPPNDANNTRDASLIVTAMQDSTQVSIIDDSSDGDDDDSWNGALRQGESYFIKIREGAINDDYGGKMDGDFIKVIANKPVTVLNMTTNNTYWMYDFVPSNNKVVGTDFYLYNPMTHNLYYSLFAFYGGTDVRIIDITSAVKTTSGLVTVRADSLGTTAKVLLSGGQNTGIRTLASGRVLHVVSSRNIAVEYGALQLDNGNSRDGAAYVPSENGSKMGQNFYFVIPGADIERELRIVSYTSNAQVNVYGTNDSGRTYTLVTSFNLNKYDRKNLIGADLGTYHFFHVTSSKSIAVFIATWMETGNYGTSDDMWSVSNEDGQALGKKFTTYMAPPGDEPQGGVADRLQLSHLYFYANDTTEMEIYDIDSYGEYVELYNTTAQPVPLQGWSISSNNGVCTFRSTDTIPALGYFLLEYNEKATNTAASFVYGTQTPDFRLHNGSDRITLRNGALIADQVRYTSSWASHGVYYSLERRDPQGSGTSAANWADAQAGAFQANAAANLGAYYGTPKAQNTNYTAPGAGTKTVVVNEFMSGRIYGRDTVHYNNYGDFALDTTQWEALNNGDQPNSGSTDPEAPYLTVESNKPLSVISANWNDNWLAYVGAVIPATPQLTFAPDYYQRKPGKTVVLTLTAWNSMYYALDSVVTSITIPKKLNYTLGMYSTPAQLGGTTPQETQNPDSTWTLIWQHGAKTMLSTEPPYIFRVTTMVDSGLLDSTFLISRGSITGKYAGDVYTAQEYATILVGVEKSLSNILFTNAAGESTATYGRGDSVRVAVHDDDENEAALARDSLQVWVYNTANGDSEQVVLRESGANTAYFMGAVRTVLTGAAAKNNARLVVNANDTLITRYIDADDPSDICLAQAIILGITRIEIVDASGTAVGDLATTTDNDTLLFFVNGYDSLNNPYPRLTVIWSVVGGIGTVQPGSGDSTRLRLTTAGSGYVKAEYGTLADSTGTISVAAGRTARLQLAPQTYNGSAGDTVTFTVNGQDADSNVITDLGTLTWTGGDSVGVWLDTTGDTARLHLVRSGVDTVIVTSDYGLADTSGSIAALHGTAVQVRISIDSCAVSADSTVQFTVWAYDAAGDSWVVDSIAVLDTDDSTASVVNGLYVPVHTGDNHIYVSYNGTSDTCVVTVQHGAAIALLVTPASATVMERGTQAFHAQGQDADGNHWDLTNTATWSETDPGGTVSAQGLYTVGDSLDTFLVRAVYAGRSDSAQVVVISSGTISYIIIEYQDGRTASDTALTTDNDTTMFLARWYTSAHTAGGTVNVQWHLAGQAVGAVDSGPDSATVLTLTRPGQCRVVAVYNDSISDTTGLITVTAGRLARLYIAPQTAVLDIDDTLTLSVTGFDADNNPVTTLGSLTWNGGEQIGAYEDSLGDTAQFVAATPGRDTLAVSSSLGIQAQTGTIIVMPGAPVRLVITPDSATVTTDIILTFHVAGFDIFGNQVPDSVLDVVWRNGSGIGYFSDSLGSSGAFTVTRVGVDSVMAFDRAHTIADTSGKIRSQAGQTAFIRIFTNNDTVRTTASKPCSAFAFDADSNLIGAVMVTWNVGGAIGGACSLAMDSVTTYRPDRTTGTGFIYAGLSGMYFDTVTVVVIAGTVSRIAIVDSARDTVEALSFTTDQDGKQFYVIGYDGGGWELGLAPVAWRVIGLDSIGFTVPDSGESTALEVVRIGTGRLVAIFNDSISDTTGLITVTGGHARRMIIAPRTGTLSADDSLRFTVMGVDADSNTTFDLGTVSWSTLGGITGGFSPNNTGSSDTTWFNPVRAGQGRIKAHSTTYGIEDSTDLITVIPGDTAYLAIVPAGPVTIYLRETQKFTALGYDADHNFVDTITANWDTTGGLYGTCSPFNNTPVFIYTSLQAGQGWIHAAHGSMRDSVEVLGSPYSVDSVMIAFADTTELGDTTWTTDNDSIKLVAYGYDSTGVFLGRVNVDWSVLGTVVGNFTRNNADSVFLMLNRPGTARLAIAYQATVAHDTSGTILVQPGRARFLALAPDAATLLVGDTLPLALEIRDADSNLTANYSILVWGNSHRAGRLQAIDNLHQRFVADTLGTDTLIAASSFGLTDTCIVSVIPRPASFDVDVNKTDPYLKEAVLCTLKVLDRFGNIIIGYNQALHRIVIEAVVRTNGVERAPQGAVEYSGVGVVDNGNDGYIQAGAVFDAGRFVVRISYNRAGDSLVFSFREDTTDISGAAPAVMWLDPNLLSQVYLFPSPVDFNNNSMMKIDYMLKYDSDVQVRIFSAEGSFVWEKNYRSGAVGGRRSFNHIEWDGRNRHGKNVGSGAYVVRIRVTCKEGEMEKRYKIGVAGRR
jgi:hypothetical protein